MGIGARRRDGVARGRGFTLIEILVVVMIMGLVAVVLSASIGSGGVGARQRRAMQDMASMLGLARAEAMQVSEERRVEIGTEGERVWLRYDGRDRSWGETALRITGRGRTLAEVVPERREGDTQRLEVSFDGLGRTASRVIVLDGRGDAAGRGGGAGAGGGRLWVLSFDPVSGAVSVAPGDEG